VTLVNNDIASLADRHGHPDPARYFAHPKYRADIDGLRAIAVLSVVGFHAFPSWLRGGFVGVDVFFVISGFLISSIIMRGLYDGTFRFSEFYSRRIRRIFPALILVLAASFACGWFVLFPEALAQLSKHVAAGAGFSSNLALWREAGYFDRAAATKPLLHLWSLGIEEQFYLAWPLLLYTLRRERVVLLFSIGVAVLSFALNVIEVRSGAVAAFYSPATRCWELMVGCFAALTPALRHEKTTGRSVQSAFGAALLGAGVLLTNTASAFPGWWALLPTTGTYLTIASGPLAWVNRRILARPVLVWFGLISFPLYLWHWPLLSFVQMGTSGAPSLGMRGTVVVASVGLAWLTYVLVERPIRSRQRTGRDVIVLCALMCGLGLVGYGTYTQGGFATRFPAGVRNLLAFDYDFRVDARVLECWVTDVPDYQPFANSCMDRSENKTRVVLWGDSHAGRLYPGVKNIGGDRIALSDFARDSCPPIMAYGSRTCMKSADDVIKNVTELRPKTVILFARWSLYEREWEPRSEIAKNLLVITDELAKLGAQNVVVLGPAPVWQEELPKLLYRHVRFDFPLYRIPERLNTDLDLDVMQADTRLKGLLAYRPHVRYVSLIEFLCNHDGCLTHVPDAPAGLMTWDYGHFTTAGAEMVAGYIRDRNLLY
jgi:peptidoglycan/LPS O-acetylase OafA/YrhL